MEAIQNESLVKGQAEAWHYVFAFADSMVVKCAVELRIPDIIHSHGAPITISQIAASLDTPSPDISYLTRIMRLLARRKVFTAHHPSDGGDTLYGPTDVSRWLLRDSDLTLAPMLIQENTPWQINPWHYLAEVVKNGGSAFKKVHGCEFFELTASTPEFSKVFNAGMACTAAIVSRAVVSGYKDGFSSIGSLVDVGGNVGRMISQIVKANPHIKGINYDLPHVIDAAPDYEGVTHVAGNMFESVPKADAYIMKWVLHDWFDEDCVKVLKNCRQAMTKKTGKVIIVEIVLQPEGDGTFDDTGLVFDALMLAHNTGKERTELEWEKLLKQAGFARYNIIKIPALTCIIEAFPE